MRGKGFRELVLNKYRRILLALRVLFVVIVLGASWLLLTRSEQYTIVNFMSAQAFLLIIMAFLMLFGVDIYLETTRPDNDQALVEWERVSGLNSPKELMKLLPPDSSQKKKKLKNRRILVTLKSYLESLLLENNDLKNLKNAHAEMMVNCIQRARQVVRIPSNGVTDISSLTDFFVEKIRGLTLALESKLESNVVVDDSQRLVLARKNEKLIDILRRRRKQRHLCRLDKQRLRQDVENFKSSLDASREYSVELKNKIDARSKEHSLQVSTLTEEIRALRQQIADAPKPEQLSATLKQSHLGQLAKLKGQINALKATVSSTEKELLEAERLSQVLKADLEACKQELKECKVQIVDITLLNEKLTQLQEELTTSAAQKELLVAELESAHSDIDAFKSKFIQSEAKQANLQVEIEKLTVVLKDMEIKDRTNVSALTELQAQIDSILEEKVRLLDENEKHADFLSLLASESGDLFKFLSEMYILIDLIHSCRQIISKFQEVVGCDMELETQDRQVLDKLDQIEVLKSKLESDAATILDSITSQ